jgi:hypothetical protein
VLREWETTVESPRMWTSLPRFTRNIGEVSHYL